MKLLLLGIFLLFPTQEEIAEPTPAPSKQECLYFWTHSYDGSVAWSSGVDPEEARPWYHRFDPFAGVEEGPDYGYTLQRTTTAFELRKRAWIRARQFRPRWCWPGEQDW